MNIDIDQAISFLIMWLFPIFFMVRAYIKMDQSDRNDAKKDFKTPRFIFTIGFLAVDMFITQLGSVLSIDLIHIIGTIMLIVGGIVATIDIWGRNKTKSIVVFLLLAVAIIML